MVGESDQVKWRGVRKVAPAIADLGAIERPFTEKLAKSVSSSGLQTLTFSIIPAGKLWVITHINAWADAGISDFTNIFADINGTLAVLRRKKAPAVDEEVLFSGRVILIAGDGIVVKFYGMTIGDFVQATTLGFEIAQY